MIGEEIDDHKLMYHPERVSKWLKEGDCFPIYVEIGLTNRCNHNCIFCALDWTKQKPVDIEREVMLSALEDMVKGGVKSIMFSGEGEPLLHNDVPLFVQSAKKAGMDVAITTNGVFFDKDKADHCLSALSWIRFSTDAATKETYSRVHGTKVEDFDRLMQNIEYALRKKREGDLPVTIGVQTLILPTNIREINTLAERCKEMGVDNLQIKPYSHHPSSKNDLRVTGEKVKELDESLKGLSDEKFHIHFRRRTIKRIERGCDYQECYGLPFFALIDAKGNVIPCNLYYNNPKFTYGNLHEESFSEIWLGDRRRQVLGKIRKEGVEKCRRGCRLDAINRYLERLKNPTLHDNFI